MKQFRTSIYTTVLALALGGCTGEITNPVVFGQATSVGITIGQSSTTQAPEFVLGYKDVNIAILPTAITDATGDKKPIGSKTTAKDGSTFEETFSVLGQFDVSAQNGTSADQTQQQQQQQKVALGKFFATGDAAKKLAAGFACSVSDGRDVAHCHPTKPAKPE